MRNVWCLTMVLAGGLLTGALAQERDVEPVAVDGDFRHGSDMDSVVLMLVDQLSKSETEARDASVKLSQIGKRAVPVLGDLLGRAPSEQVKHYAAVALSRIRHPSAVRALLPMLTAKDISREMRLLAIESASGSGIDDATAPLTALVDSEEDPELRMKALQALGVMPAAWRDCENLFVKTLQDRSEEVRLLGVQVCFYAAAVKIVYGAAEPALLELSEMDPSTTVRCRSLRALARMKSGRAVALSVRLLEDDHQPRDVVRQAVSTIQTITEVSLQDAAAIRRWWEQHGKARYASAPALRPFNLQKEQGKGQAAGPADKTEPTRTEAGENEAAKTVPGTADPMSDTATRKTDLPSVSAATAKTALDTPGSVAVRPPSEDPTVKRPPASTPGKRPLLDETEEPRPLSGVPIR